MILSHSKKFIFIHVYKVAGTSVSKVLSPYNIKSIYMYRPYRWVSRNYSNIFPNPYPRHARAAHLQKILPKEVFDNYFKFAFVRNPWDWHLSLYSYSLKKRGHHETKIIKELGSFEEYVKWVSRKPSVTLQKDFLYHNGDCLVDYIGKMENLNLDFKKICEKIDIPQIDLPHLNKSNQKKYQEFYNDLTKDIIYKLYKRDIELFEYEF